MDKTGQKKVIIFESLLNEGFNVTIEILVAILEITDNYQLNRRKPHKIYTM